MGNKRKTPAARVQQRPRQDTVVVAFIHPGMVSAFFMTSLTAMLLQDQGTNRRIVGLIQEWSSANVSAPRNSLTSKFVDDYEADWLLWIDSDMGWEADALERLLAVADPATAPIVGGLCFGAFEDRLFPTMYQIATVDGELTTIRLDDYPDDTMMQVTGTGAAFLLIHRSALVAIRDRGFNRTFPWFQETEISGKPAGEDLTFCIRAGLCELPVHVHTGIKVGHHKSHLLTHDMFRKQQSERETA
jgi:hypothetical protein